MINSIEQEFIDADIYDEVYNRNGMLNRPPIITIKESIAAFREEIKVINARVHILEKQVLNNE